MPANGENARTAARVRTALVAVGTLITVTIITLCLQRYGLSTLAVEHEAIRGWLAGDGLYAYRSPANEAGAALPPALALILAPLTLLPLSAAGWLLALAGLTALVLTIRVVTGPVARRYGRRPGPFVLAAAALALLTEPVRAAVGLGRPELLIFALLAADLLALRRASRARHRSLTVLLRSGRSAARRRTGVSAPSHRPDPRSSRSSIDPAVPGPLRRSWTAGTWAGTGTGLAAALSPAALLFVVHLLITRQRRAALTALATAAAVALAALALAPAETITWYGATMWEIDRPAPVSDLDNQSLAGVMARLYGFPAPPVLVWLSFGTLLMAVGLIRARSAHAEGDEVSAFTIVGLTAAVIGPVTTATESLWLLPAVLILADTGLRRRLNVRLARSARFTGVGYLVTAAAGYLVLILTPVWSLRWNIPAFVLIVLVNALPWRHGTPTLPTRRPTTARRAAIPLPRGG
jgi:alpha-1,2-mannosyltransferase